METTEKTYTLQVAEVAEIVGVSRSTIRNLADSGALPCMQSPSGWRRFNLEDVQTLAASYFGPQPRPRQRADAPKDTRSAFEKLVDCQLNQAIKLAQSKQTEQLKEAGRLLNFLAEIVKQGAE